MPTTQVDDFRQADHGRRKFLLQDIDADMGAAGIGFRQHQEEHAGHQIHRDQVIGPRERLVEDVAHDDVAEDDHHDRKHEGRGDGRGDLFNRPQHLEYSVKQNSPPPGCRSCRSREPRLAFIWPEWRPRLRRIPSSASLPRLLRPSSPSAQVLATPFIRSLNFALPRAAGSRSERRRLRAISWSRYPPSGFAGRQRG